MNLYKKDDKEGEESDVDNGDDEFEDEDDELVDESEEEGENKDAEDGGYINLQKINENNEGEQVAEFICPHCKKPIDIILAPSDKQESEDDDF